MIRWAGKGSHLPIFSPMGAAANGASVMKMAANMEAHAKKDAERRDFLRRNHRNPSHAKRRAAGAHTARKPMPRWSRAIITIDIAGLKTKAIFQPLRVTGVVGSALFNFGLPCKRLPDQDYFLAAIMEAHILRLLIPGLSFYCQKLNFSIPM